MNENDVLIRTEGVQPTNDVQEPINGILMAEGKVPAMEFPENLPITVVAELGRVDETTGVAATFKIEIAFKEPDTAKLVTAILKNSLGATVKQKVSFISKPAIIMIDFRTSRKNVYSRVQFLTL